MDGDLPRDTMSIVQKARLNSITLEKRNLGTHMRAIIGEVTARANRHLRNQLRCIFCLSELFNRKDSLCSMIATNIL
jgi:hypothetical protein